MAALPYWQVYPADLLADTMHLDAQEFGAYTLLLLNYWQTGKPLPNDDKRLARIARCDAEQWGNIRSTVVQFFDEQNGVLVQTRIEDDLAAVRKKADDKIKAGKASARSRAARARHKQKEQKGNSEATGVGTPVEQPLEQNGNTLINVTNTSNTSNESAAAAAAADGDGGDRIPDYLKVGSQQFHACGVEKLEMTTDWRPSDHVYILLAQDNIPTNYAAASRATFVAHFHGKHETESNWNRRFLNWVKRDWLKDPGMHNENRNRSDQSTAGRNSAKTQERREEIERKLRQQTGT